MTQACVMDRTEAAMWPAGRCSMPEGNGCCAGGKRVGLRQRHAQARLQAGHLARLHGLVRAELLPQRLQLAAHPRRLPARGLHRSQRPRLNLRQPARRGSHPFRALACMTVHACVLDWQRAVEQAWTSTQFQGRREGSIARHSALHICLFCHVPYAVQHPVQSRSHRAHCALWAQHRRSSAAARADACASPDLCSQAAFSASACRAASSRALECLCAAFCAASRPSDGDVHTSQGAP